jgi:hypothetical protein
VLRTDTARTASVVPFSHLLTALEVVVIVASFVVLGPTLGLDTTRFLSRAEPRQ